MSRQFGPSVRLRARHEFQSVQQQGSRVSMRYLTMLARPNALGHDRLGIIASKRVGGAVARNRAKRRLREIFRQQSPEASASQRQSLDVVIVAKADLVSAPIAAIVFDFTSALARLRRRYQPA